MSQKSTRAFSNRTHAFAILIAAFGVMPQSGQVLRQIQHLLVSRLIQRGTISLPLLLVLLLHLAECAQLGIRHLDLHVQRFAQIFAPAGLVARLDDHAIRRAPRDQVMNRLGPRGEPEEAVLLRKRVKIAGDALVLAQVDGEDTHGWVCNPPARRVDR